MIYIFSVDIANSVLLWMKQNAWTITLVCPEYAAQQIIFSKYLQPQNFGIKNISKRLGDKSECKVIWPCTSAYNSKLSVASYCVIKPVFAFVISCQNVLYPFNCSVLLTTNLNSQLTKHKMFFCLRMKCWQNTADTAFWDIMISDW